MLIVISIIGILATMSIGSYQKTRQSAEVNIQIDTFIDELRTLKLQAANSNDTCYGLLITKTEIKNIHSQYINPYTKCDPTIQISDSTIKLNRNQILRDQQIQPLDQINILFYPPLGETDLPDLDLLGNQSQESLIFKLALNDSMNNQIVTFNAANGSIQKSYLKDPTQTTSHSTKSYQLSNSPQRQNSTQITSSTQNFKNTTLSPTTNSSTINNSSTQSPTTSTKPISTFVKQTDTYDPLAPSFQSDNNFTTGSNTSSNTKDKTSNSKGPHINTPNLNYKTNPVTPPKQNPISFVLITILSIIIGIYLTRSKA